MLKTALDSQVNGGKYFGPTGLLEMKGAPDTAKRTEYSRKEDVAARLWNISEQLTETSFEVAAA